MSKVFSIFRKVAFLEGISYLLLLLIAMPLKYIANMPQPVKVLGSIHGFLFVAFIALAGLALLKYKLKIGWFVKALIVSFLPFGTFYMDKYWKQEQITLENNE